MFDQFATEAMNVSILKRHASTTHKHHRTRKNKLTPLGISNKEIDKSLNS